MFTQIRILNLKFISVILFAVTFLVGGFFINVSNVLAEGGEVDITSPNIVSYSLSEEIISPDGDGLKDSTSIDIEFSEKIDYIIKIIDSDNSIVKSWSGSAKNPEAKIWDGLNAKNGVYIISISGKDLSDNLLETDTTKTITVEMIPEDVIIPTPENINIQIIPDSFTKKYGEVDPVFTFTYSPELEEGDEFTGALDRQPGEIVGEYQIRPGTLSAGDKYSLSFQNVPFYIEKKDNQVLPIDDGTGNDSVIVDRDDTEILVGYKNPLTITVEGSISSTLNLSEFITPGTGYITLPDINIHTDIVDIMIPAGVANSDDILWDGIIILPEITDIVLPEVEGQDRTLESAMQIGLSSMKLTFEKAVRITIPNQAGKKIGYTRGTESFTEITNTCVLDDQELINIDLVEGKEDCKIDSDSDLVIWTKHFTKFATYTEEKVIVKEEEIVEKEDNPRSSNVIGSVSPLVLASNKIISNEPLIKEDIGIKENKIILNELDNQEKVITEVVEEQEIVNQDLLNTPKDVIDTNLLVASAGNIMGISSNYFWLGIILLMILAHFIIVYRIKKNIAN